TGIPGAITGHMALSEIRKEDKDGRGMAIAGLITSYLGILGSLVIIVFILMMVLFTGTVATEAIYHSF
ncbi:MAG: DUF4190 domain-containing protein, partial [Verrucomicrobiota bacterium]